MYLSVLSMMTDAFPAKLKHKESTVTELVSIAEERLRARIKEDTKLFEGKWNVHQELVERGTTGEYSWENWVIELRVCVYLNAVSPCYYIYKIERKRTIAFNQWILFDSSNFVSYM
jgi:hypothetical protein